MSNSVNKAILIGHLGADPETRSFQNGGKVCNLRLATSESWKDKSSGEKRERTEWHTVSIYSDGLVSVAERFLRKGSRVYLEGKLETSKWQDKDGNDRYTTEVVLRDFGSALVMLDGKGGDSRDDYREKTPSGPMASGGGASSRPGIDDEDSIPF